MKTQICNENRTYSAFTCPSNPIIGNNLRVRKTGSSGTTNYLYYGLSVVLETDNTGAISKTYNPGISATDKFGNKFYYLYDGLGSVVNLIDQKGILVQAYQYDVFGVALGVKKDQNSFRFVGAGQVNSDDDVELEYMHFRWFDPKIGRFISRDPLGPAGGVNLYSYVNNNPINRVDLLGLYSNTIPFTNLPVIPGLPTNKDVEQKLKDAATAKGDNLSDAAAAAIRDASNALGSELSKLNDKKTPPAEKDKIMGELASKILDKPQVPDNVKKEIADLCKNHGIKIPPKKD